MAHNHKFKEMEISILRKKLLKFYDEKKRDLPWRRLANSSIDINQKIYSVWVSEIMLQQTQVATVIDYYNRWMQKWPTVEKLATADLTEVNEMWSGLGYYSRGRRLLEGAKKIVAGSGDMPRSSKKLIEEIPGVGRYTAGAVSSIALNEVTGVVDGNVIRVLSRLRLIGLDSSSPAASELYWELANAIVDPERPGDFNQAMMELGATVCQPKITDCGNCPLAAICKAYYKNNNVISKTQKKLKDETNTQNEILIDDIEEVPGCKYCLGEENPWNESLGVLNYPRKGKKKPAKQEKYISVVVESNGQFLLSQRSNKGLLANLWEFPLILIDENSGNELKLIRDQIKARFSLTDLQHMQLIGEVTHIFSHIHHTYVVYHCTVDGYQKSNTDETMWLHKEDIMNKAAVSTAIKKIMKLNEKVNSKVLSKAKRKSDSLPPLKQKTLESMFSKKRKISK